MRILTGKNPNARPRTARFLFRDEADRLLVRVARHGGVWMGVLVATAVAGAVATMF